MRLRGTCDPEVASQCLQYCLRYGAASRTNRGWLLCLPSCTRRQALLLPEKYHRWDGWSPLLGGGFEIPVLLLDDII